MFCSILFDLVVHSISSGGGGGRDGDVDGGTSMERVGGCVAPLCVGTRSNDDEMCIKTPIWNIWSMMWYFIYMKLKARAVRYSKGIETLKRSEVKRMSCTHRAVCCCCWLGKKVRAFWSASMYYTAAYSICGCMRMFGVDVCTGWDTSPNVWHGMA